MTNAATENFGSPAMRFFHARLLARCVAALVAASLVGACTSLLPHSVDGISPFKTFADAQTAIEGLIPMQSDSVSLAKMGIDPASYPNTTLLTHADVVRRFIPPGILEKKDLDPGIVACIEARDACRGLDVVASRISTDRTGNFFADFFNFSRRSDTTGWRFNAVILLLNNVVVYRNWGGQPLVMETNVHTNPLGPLQDAGPSSVSVPASVVIR
jgi:hypothetical protein